MDTSSLGKQAEAIAVNFLLENHHKILEVNWRRPDCEIDIITCHKKTKCMHFVEVKYRSNNRYGSGLSYITSDKLRRMEYAAKIFMHLNDYHSQSVLSAIEVSGETMSVTSFVEQASL